MAMFGESGEMRVTIKREELLERLKRNRTEHAETYAEAIKLWREDVEKTCKAIDVSEATSWPSKLKRLEGSCPSSHVEEYDRVIDMFSMSVSDTVELDQSSFNRYCRDEWSWKSRAMSNRYYAMSAETRSA